jgi:hypothetical protein
MAKYDPLRRFLADNGRNVVELPFEDVAAMVDGGLPRSAYDRGRRMWWSNIADGRHVRAPAWLEAGYAVAPGGLTTPSAG